MEVHVYFLFELIMLLIDIGCNADSIKTTEMCRHTCYIFGTCGCHTNIECETGRRINITEVEYRDTVTQCGSQIGNCGSCCYEELNSIPEHTTSIRMRCNNQRTCNLYSWNSNEKWKMKISYVCHELSTVAPSTKTTNSSTFTASTMTPTTVKTTATTATFTTQSATSSSFTTSRSITTYKITPQTSDHLTNSSRVVKRKDEESADFPLAAAVAIPLCIGVMVLVIVLVFCVVRRRSSETQNGRKTNTNTLPMRNTTDNNNDNPQLSGNREDLQEAHEQEYVDTTSHKVINTNDDAIEQEYVNTDNGINATYNDEYNTLNTHPVLLQLDPNYDHMPKGLPTTVDETYSHVTEIQTTGLDAMYSHLQDCKSNSTHNAKSNQNSSNGVSNHIITLSVQDIFYNKSQANFTKGPISQLNQTGAEKDEYDHIGWNQARSLKPIASSNGAIKTCDKENFIEQADDEYAVVNKKSDTVESSDGHNYFVLEKQFY